MMVRSSTGFATHDCDGSSDSGDNNDNGGGVRWYIWFDLSWLDSFCFVASYHFRFSFIPRRRGGYKPGIKMEVEPSEPMRLHSLLFRTTGAKLSITRSGSRRWSRLAFFMLLRFRKYFGGRGLDLESGGLEQSGAGTNFEKKLETISKSSLKSFQNC